MSLALDPIVLRLNMLEKRIAHLEGNAEAPTTSDADTVDGFHASGTPTADTLLALNSSGVFPADVANFATLTTDAQVWSSAWTNDTLWSLPNGLNWNTDSQSTSIPSPRRKSVVIVLGVFHWCDATSGRIDAVQFRWKLGDATSFETMP